MAVGNVIISNHLYDANLFTKNYEMAIELTYSLPLNKYFTIQPDIQYIINTGAQNSLENAFVGLIRFYIEY